MAADQVNSVASLHEDIDENDELQVMVQKITMANQKALQDTMVLIDRDQLAKAIDMMLQAGFTSMEWGPPGSQHRTR